MLLSYKFNNFCSFDENAEFELLAPSNKVKNRFPDNYVVTDAGYDVLKVAVVIGENAGGKTNFINSLSYLKSMFEDTKAKHSYRPLINVNNLKSECPAQSNTKQEFDICIIGKSELIYHYNLQIDEFCIVEEKLTYRSKKSNQEKVVIHVKREQLNRMEEKKSIAASYDLNMDNCDENVKKILDQSFFNKGELGLFVSKLAILGDMYAIEFVNWMNEELIVESKNFNYYLYKNLQTQDDDLRIIKDNRFLDILRMVDYSICNIEIDDEKPFRKTKKMENIFQENLAWILEELENFLHGQFNFLGLYMRIKQFLQMKWIGLSILFWLRELLHLLMETSTGDSSFFQVIISYIWI